MSETNAQEPTMEEILASIRRIISEDDAPPAAMNDAAPAASGPNPYAQTAFAAEPEDEEDDDVLELTHPMTAPVPEPPAPEPVQAEAPRPSPLGDLDVSQPSSAPSPADEALVSGYTSSAAASSFGALSRSLSMPSDGRTLEDVVNMLLKPLLKDWLDRNLPSIVEHKVQTEVERISRSRGL